MNGQKIGILDSGVGGLSVVLEIRKRLASVDIHYVGDSAECPYGTKSPSEIRDRVGLLVDYLLTKQVSLIVIACNSATIHAVEWLRSEYPLSFVGMEPGVKPAAALTQTGVIGVLATEASIAGEKFLQLVDSTAHGVNVITQPCPDFVDLVERGILQGPQVDSAIKQYTAHLLAKNADVLVLGCTHYPFLRPEIDKACPGIGIIDSGEPVARRVNELLTNPTGTGQLIIESTGDLDQLNKLAPVLLGDLADTCVCTNYAG